MAAARSPDLTRIALIGLAVLAVGIVVVGFGLIRGGGPLGGPAGPDDLFPEVAGASEVGEIRIEGPEARTTLTRGSGGTWRVAEKDGYPARGERVAEVLSAIAGMGALNRRELDRESFASVGVTEDSGNGVRVAIDDGDGAALARFFVGTEKAAPGAEDLRAYHVRQVDGDTVWLADADLRLPADPLSWVDDRAFAVSRSRIHAVRTAPATGTPVHIRRNSPRDSSFDGVNLGDDVELEGGWVLGKLAVPFQEMRFKDVAKAESELDPAAGAGYVATFDGVKIVFAPREPADREGVWARFAATAIDPVTARDEGENGEAPEPPVSVAELNERLQPWTFRLPDFQAERLRRSIADLPRKGVGDQGDGGMDTEGGG